MSAQINSVVPCVFVLFILSRVQMTAATRALGFATNKPNTKQVDFKPRLEPYVADDEVTTPNPLQCRYDGFGAFCNGDELGPRRFTYIPLLPKHITSLCFMYNHLGAIKDKHFFSNVTQLTDLDLSDNDITWVSAGVFGLMPSLSRLAISSNPLLNLTSLRNILATPSLLKMELDTCWDSSYKGNFFEDDISNVQKMTFSYQGMDGVLNLSPLCNLKQLDTLVLFWNRIAEITTNCALPSLRVLYLEFNYLTSLFPSCDLNGQSFFPELEALHLPKNRIERIVDICLPKLQRLILAENYLGIGYMPGAFDSVHFPALQDLVLDENSPLRYTGLKESFFYNSPVRTLSLSGNWLDFGSKVDIDTFSSCRNISKLFLDYNIFSSVSDERFQSLFGHLPLVRLSLMRTEFTAVSPKTFSGLTQLEELQLCCNKIVYIPDGTFDHLVSLRYLDLSQNQIKTIGQNTFNDRLRENLRGLCAHANPFVCSCDLVWFQSWLRSHSNLLIFPYPGFWVECNQNYVCSDRPDNVSDFVIPKQACLMSQDVSGNIITFCTTVTLTLTTLLLLFTYRWHLRLLLYEAFRGRDDGARRRRLLQNNFDYDVFVSYDSEDYPWIRQHLMPELEGRRGLRLCVHERDFIPGHNIVDNIARCVESSKKIMMVFSNNFVLSQWCQFELTFCLRHVMDYDDVLLIVCVDDVTNREMTTAMMAVLKTTTYIQWAESDNAIRAFWGRLRIALREITDLEHRV